jgi:nitrate/nitrite transporter NarK
MYVCGNYGWWFSLNYLPAFMNEQYGVRENDYLGAFFKGGPLLFGALGCIVGGLLADRYIRRTGDKKWGRRLYGMIGHGLAGLCLFACILVPFKPSFAWVFALVIALSGFAGDLTMGSAWAACQDIGRRYSAIVSGCMNMIGNLGGAVTTYVTGWIVELSIKRHAESIGVGIRELTKDQEIIGARPGWELNFALYGMVYISALAFWMMIDAKKPISTEPHPAAQ